MQGAHKKELGTVVKGGASMHVWSAFRALGSLECSANGVMYIAIFRQHLFPWARQHPRDHFRYHKDNASTHWARPIHTFMEKEELEHCANTLSKEAATRCGIFSLRHCMLWVWAMLNYGNSVRRARRYERSAVILAMVRLRNLDRQPCTLSHAYHCAWW